MDASKKGRHKLLQDLSQELTRGFIEQSYDVWGRKWTLRTLNDGEESWSDKFVVVGSTTAMLSSRRAAKLAASIQAINDVPLDQLFVLPEDTEDERMIRSFIVSDPVRRRFWLAEKMYEFLEEQPDELVKDLYAKYGELLDQRKKVLDDLKNSFAGMPKPA